LIADLDKKLMILLRDGRTLIGYLRMIDQFANLVLHKTIERIHVGNKFGDISRGIFIIRGENVVLCGEIDNDKAEEGLIRVAVEDILTLQQAELEVKQQKERFKLRAMQECGLMSTYEAVHEDY